jgi:tetratricopeptide (TPR) repeat protein
VLLYELLTGTTPFDKARLKEVGFDELRRIIREEEPPRPSTRISTLGQAATTVSTQRKSDPKRLSQLCRGELDWIVMKALEKDRNRRYETASAFAADVLGYLHDEPVQACPPSAWYRFRKFARRNKARLAVAGLILSFTVLLGGSVGWFVRDRTLRHAQAIQEARAALADVAQLRRERKWKPALTLARRAEALLPGEGADAGLRRQFTGLIGDLHMAATLDDIRLRRSEVKENHFNNAAADAGYAAAFRAFGVDVETLEPAEAAQRLRASTITEELVAALDDWVMARRPKGDTSWKRLLQTARLIDEDAWGNRLRSAVENQDARAILKLAGSREVVDLSPSTQVLLGAVLEAVGAVEEARRVLRAGAEQHPGDFWLNQSFGVLCQSHQPRGPGDGVRFLTAALALRPDNPGVLLNLGNALRANGDPDGAIRQYKAALAIDHRYCAAVLNMGNALDDKGDLEGAIRQYEAALAIDPREIAAHRNLGLMAIKKGDRAGAIRHLEAALAIEPRYAAAHYDLGYVLQNHDRERARPHLEAVLALDPTAWMAHGVLGNILLDKGDYKGAIHHYKVALAIEPKSAICHYNLGNALRAQRRLGEAMDAYREAIRIKQDYPEAHVNLGTALFDRELVDGAIDEFRKAIGSKQDFPEAYRAYDCLGIALKAKGRLDAAIVAFRQALVKKDYPEGHLNLANALLDRGLVDGAIEEFRKALESRQAFPEAYKAHDGLGVALTANGQLEEAIEQFGKALQIKKDFPEAHVDLGNALRAKELLDDAIVEFRRAISYKQNFPQAYKAYYNLGNALRDQGRLDQAMDAYRKGIRLKRDHLEAHFNLANILEKKGLHDKAIVEYRQAMGSGRDGPAAEAHFGLGTVLMRKGQLDEAINEFRQALQIKQDHPEAHCNLGLALQQQGDFRQALVELRRGHELGVRDPRWRYASAQWVGQCERLIELDGKLPAILSGQRRPADAAEGLAAAQLCQMPYRKCYAAAAHLFSEAFAAKPELIGNGPSPARYDAACAAALAGCGQGKDADKLDGKERARLRRQALDWLRADLAAWGRWLEKAPEARLLFVGQLRHWLADSDLAGVREREALATLPEAERQPWRQLWDDVADTLTRVQAKTMPR